MGGAALASFIGTIASGLVAVFSRFMSMQASLRLASLLAWTTVFTAFIAAVYSCTRFLFLAVQGFFVTGSGSWGTIKSAVGMGLGMFIPSNAGSVMGCVAAVWIACQIYKVQKQGIHNYSK